MSKNGTELSQGSQVFRQSRIDNDLQWLTLSVSGVTGSLRNWSRTGIGFEMARTGKSFRPGDKVANVKISSGDLEIYDGEIEIRTVKPIDTNLSFYGAALASNLLLAEGVEAAKKVNTCFTEIESGRTMIESAKPDFCQSVLSLTAALRKIQTACGEEEERWKKLPFDRRLEAERIFVPSMAKRVRDLLVAFNIRVGGQIDVEKLPEDSVYHRIFHEEVFPFFAGADLARRAYEKPRGYAGDYEMMNQIYRDSFEGEDLFGKILHNYIANENSSNSVKFRKPYFLRFYRELLELPGVHRVLSVACGPAVEYQEAVSTWVQGDLDRIHATLFDLDREALEHAQTKVLEAAMKHDKRPNATFINASVKTFLTAHPEPGEIYDLIYSGGLFDYLDNTTSAALTRKLAERLGPTGTLVIGNFTKNNSTKAFCHLLTNWSLIHKTEEEIREWAKDIPGCTTRIEYDEAKINAFLVVRKTNIRRN